MTNKRGGSFSSSSTSHRSSVGHHHHPPSSITTALVSASSLSNVLSTPVLLPPPPPPPPPTTHSLIPPPTKVHSSILYKVDWNNDLEFKFLRSFVGDGGHCFRPIGLNKHFNMLLAYHRFRRSMGRNVDIECLWSKLDMFYDGDYLDEIEEDHNRKQGGGGGRRGHYNLPPCLFPSSGGGGGGGSLPEFQLPEEIMRGDKRVNSKPGPKVKKRRVI